MSHFINKLFLLINLSFLLIDQYFTETNISQLKHRLIYNEFDSLLVARCILLCSKDLNQKKCERQCFQSDLIKPGTCSKLTNLSDFDLTCLNTCQRDNQCPDIQKCCHNNKCGVNCQSPLNLNTTSGIPKIPMDIEIIDHKKRHVLHISWKHEITTSIKPLIYVLEERHYFVQRIFDDQVSFWNLLALTDKTEIRLKHFHKLSFCYEFRVAAVNENGSMGFSKPSKQFSASFNIKSIPPPTELKIPKMWREKTIINAELCWKAPKNDELIIKYKIFWSRRLKGITDLDSVIVKYSTVEKTVKKFIIPNLDLNAIYFIQVQSIGQLQNKRLKSEKTAIFLNTSYV